MLDTPFPQTMIPLAPLTGTKPPKKRLDDAVKAQTLVASLWQAAQERNLKMAAIQGQIDGNPPYSPLRMRAAGRASDANFNTLEAKAVRSAALVPYYDLFAGGNRYVEAKLKLDSDDFRATYASGVASEEYDRMLRRWRNFENVMAGVLTDMLTYGRGHAPWEALGSWRFTKVAFYRVLVPDATPIDEEKLECIVILQDWTVSNLYKNIMDGDVAREAGWNVKETMSAIANAVPVDPIVPNDPMAAQAMLRDSDIYVSARSSTVQTATIFVREFNGKWSELIVRRDQIPTMSTAASNVAPAEFMFKAYDRYDCVQEILNSFFFEVADNDWNGASGLGKDIFTIMQLKDRLACTQADAVFLRNSLVLQPRQALDKTRLNLLQVGKVTYLPEGMEVQQSTILGDISSTIEVSRELSQQVERNTGIYRPTLEKVSGNPETLGEFQMKFAQATVLSAAAINRFYSQLDRLYEEQWDRVIEAGTKGEYDKDGSREDWQNEARRFVKCCKDRDVSEKDLNKLESIRAYRNIGNGSSAMRQQALQSVMQAFPLYPADGQLNILEDFTRSIGSQTAVERYLPATARMNLPNDQVAWAMLENAALREGAPVTWTPTQNNLIHAQTHLQAGAQAAQSLQQGSSALEVLSFLDGIGAHVAVHIEHERQKPTSKEALKVIEEQWKRLAQITDQLKQQAQADAEKQQELQQQQQDVVTDADIKKLEIMLKDRNSREKMMGTLKLREEKQNADIALKVQKQQVDNSLADASTAAEIERNLAKAQTDHQLALSKPTGSA
jgi:hypothetical protein